MRGLHHEVASLAPRLDDQAEALLQSSRIYLRASRPILSSRRTVYKEIPKQSL
jgi:hypothetical protein